MQTIGQAAKELQIPKSTVRGWIADFNEYLSDNAKPEKGKIKRLDNDDMAVLWSVHFWRSQHKSKPEINDMLSAGERIQPPNQTSSTDDTKPPQNEPQEPQQALEVFQAFKTTIESYERQIEIKDTRINELTERVIELTERAAAAEAQIESKHVGWFDKLLGRG